MSVLIILSNGALSMVRQAPGNGGLSILPAHTFPDPSVSLATARKLVM